MAEGRWQMDGIDEVLQSFIGKQEQIPPIYSAIKMDGRKLYEYARMGQDVEIKPRQIEIYDITCDKVDVENKRIHFTVSCGKGTYIRSLCEDIADRLGTVGYMKELKRLKVGDFTIEQSIELAELESNKENTEWLESKMITIEELFQESPKLQLDENRLQHFLNGVKITQKVEEGVYRVYSNGEFIGIGVVRDALLKRDIV